MVLQINMRKRYIVIRMPNEVSSVVKEELLSGHKLNKKIVDCKLCPRLTEYIGEVGKHQTNRFVNQVYWAKPVPTFGDPKAKLLVVGLAQVAHGGNRTEEYLQETVLVTGL